MSPETQPTRRTRAPRGTGRARLLEAAGSLFSELGVSGTSLQTIADRLGVTKAAVYHQFPTKDGIVLAVVEPVIEQLREMADAAEGCPEEEARAIVIAGLVDLALSEQGTAAVMRRDPTMAQILDSHAPYLTQIARIDAVLLGANPSPERRIALVFAGTGIMGIGGLPGLDGPAEGVRAGLIAAMTRALDVRIRD